MPINGIAVSAVAAGSVFLWSGVKGWNVSTFAGELITGKRPTGGTTNLLTAPNVPGQSIGSGAGNNISSDAIRYVGHAYGYGGAPGTNGQNPWDCSSFVNWVAGHDQSLAIPGYGPGQYNGTVHGPPTGMWGVWPGLNHISASQLQSGDLIVWTLHMGICIGNGQMVSALNHIDGTKVTPIQGFGNGPLMCYGRYK